MPSWYSVFQDDVLGFTKVSRYFALPLVELEVATQLQQNLPAPLGWRWRQELGIMQLWESLASPKSSRRSELQADLLTVAA